MAAAVILTLANVKIMSVSCTPVPINDSASMASEAGFDEAGITGQETTMTLTVEQVRERNFLLAQEQLQEGYSGYASI
jgi:hypothetical protein